MNLDVKYSIFYSSLGLRTVQWRLRCQALRVRPVVWILYTVGGLYRATKSLQSQRVEMTRCCHVRRAQTVSHLSIGLASCPPKWSVRSILLVLLHIYVSNFIFASCLPQYLVPLMAVPLSPLLSCQWVEFSLFVCNFFSFSSDRLVRIWKPSPTMDEQVQGITNKCWLR